MTDTEIFLEAQKEYNEKQTDASYITMYKKLYKCCIVQVCKFLSSKQITVSNDVKEDYARDAVFSIIRRYKKNPQYKITYLPTVCRLAVVGVMFAPQEKQERQFVLMTNLRQPIITTN